MHQAGAGGGAGPGGGGGAHRGLRMRIRCSTDIRPPGAGHEALIHAEIIRHENQSSLTAASPFFSGSSDWINKGEVTFRSGQKGDITFGLSPSDWVIRGDITFRLGP